MPKGPATTKTEFQRYLDDHPESVPSLRPIAKTYASMPKTKRAFGFWLRWAKPAVFDVAYSSWWLKHPEHFCEVYPSESSATPELAR